MISAAAAWSSMTSTERFSAWWKKSMGDRPQPLYPADAPIRTDGGRFWFDDAGQPSAILPVIDQHGEIYDLVAWSPAAPDKWYLYEGAGRDMNEAAIAQAKLWNKVLTVYASPHEWLLAQEYLSEMQGCCPLRGYEGLVGVRRVSATPALHRLIERDIRAAWPVPEMTAHAP